MPNILSPVKNSFYNPYTIDPVNITGELPENQKISSDKHRGISVFAFLIHFWESSSFLSSSNWHYFSLKFKSFWCSSNLECF